MIAKSLQPLARILSSYGLACVILVLLMVLTLFGTLEQADRSLYEVQKKYFESLIVFPDALPVPLPGGYLLLTVLFFNLMVGGMLRMRRTKAVAGVFLIHIGIATLLLGGFVEYRTSRKGHVTLFEGESAAAFRSYFEWEVVLREELDSGAVRDFVIPQSQFGTLSPGRSGRFVSEELPFEVVLAGFLNNSRPRPVDAGKGIGVDGFVLESLPSDNTAEANVAGITVTLQNDAETHTGLLWGIQRAPWTAFVDGKQWYVDLRKKSWPLPFSVHLQDFTRELHPGTGIAKSFYSDVACIEDNVQQDVRISMNEPLRRQGFTFYQASWGPGNARPGDRLFSTFAVVQNPADRVPLIACVIIALGLLAHFIPKLTRHVKAQATKVGA